MINRKPTPTDFRKMVHEEQAKIARQTAKYGKDANVPGANDPKLKRAPKDARDAHVPGANAQEIRG